LATVKGSDSQFEHLQNSWHSIQRRLANQQAGAILVRQIEHEVPEFLITPDNIFLSLLESSRQEQL
jgi:hypothetical protein